MRVVLVSKSPRRRELLKQIVPVFEVMEPRTDENIDPRGFSGSELARELSLKKLSSVEFQDEETFFIAADTVVEVDGKILGKPRNLDEARAMLSLLSGRAHFVHTGVSVKRAGLLKSAVETTKVFFRCLEPWEIEFYVENVDVLDKAGAYGIQDRGELFIERIEGSYSNVVGLPLATTYRLLRELGFKPARFVRLADVAKVVRSKNAGPFELTFDVMFETKSDYERFKSGNFIDKKRFAELYGIPEEDILVFEYFDQALALKITVKRRPPSGHLEDTDIYGAQQHISLMNYLIPWKSYG